MAPGIKRLRKLQFGKETTKGTAVAATALWRGAGDTLDDQRVLEYVDENVGIFTGTDRTIIPKLLGGLELSETPLTYEQFQYLVAMAFGGATTGTADGVGTDFIYTTNLPTTAVPTQITYTVQGGDNTEVERMEYCACTKISISGNAGEAVKVSATLMGRQIERMAGGFTGSIAVPTVTEALCSKGKVYIDAIGGTIGTTLVANAILGFKVDYTIMWVPESTMDGQLYFSFMTFTDHEVSGSLTFEHDAAADGDTGAKAIWRAQTPKLLRIKLDGPAVTTGGTVHSVKTVWLDLPIKYTKAAPIGDQNGNDIIEMSFTSKYNVTAATAGKIVVVNELTALP